MNKNHTNKSIEIWMQDTQNNDLWHNESGLIVNTAALSEREPYFEVHRVLSLGLAADQQSYHPAY